jgi:presenilin-like A22 family membrane protease
MYSGLAVLIVPIFDLQWVFIMLIVISIYDMYAVWKSKHMVKMAKFQAKNNLFAGLMIPYEQNKKIHLKISKKIKRTKVHNALLGGGDVAFPLIFAGVVMESLIKKGFTPQLAFFQTITISFLVTGAVIGLFVFAKKKKFYPAMPFISIACFIGYFVISLF